MLVEFGHLGAVEQAQPASVSATSLSSQRALIDGYCVGCHNQRTKTAGIMFDTMDLARLSDDAEVWEKAVRKLRGGMMPPLGGGGLTGANVEAFVSWLETSLDEAAAAHPNPDVALHRLNRSEYANAVEDLFGMRIDASALLPKDDEADGFDNVASVLTVSPSFLDRAHLGRTRREQSGTRQSCRPRDQRHVSPSSRNRSGRSGRRAASRHQRRSARRALFPADGDYKLNIAAWRRPATCAAWNISTRSS